MKKIAPILAIAVIASFTACKKDYTCKCKAGTTTQDIPLNNVKKKDAESSCDAANTTWKAAGGSCSL